MATQADYERLGAWAVMLNPDANVDRHNGKRTVPMEVLSLGFSRTGTLSMQEALSILAYPHPYHYSDIFANVKDADMWQEALNAKFKNPDPNFPWREHFDKLLGDCGAVTDAPSVLFWKELVDAYPEAKVVLVERDEDKWYPSASTLIEGVLNPFAQYVLRYTDPLWFGRIIGCGAAWIEAFFGSANPTQAKKNARAAYRKHYADIRAYVPKKRLLNYQLGSGWEPLCKFLGKKEPEVPFPHRNEAATLERAFGSVIAKAFKHSFVNLGAIVGAAASVGAMVWRYVL